MPSKQKFRNVCFTSYGDEKPFSEEEVVNKYRAHIRYYVFQQERCPTSGRLHWQGYVEFWSQMAMSTIQKLIRSKAHLAERRGTAQEAGVGYCHKSETAVPGTRVEYGECSQQGRRKDIDDVVQDLQDGKQDPAHDLYILRYPRGYQVLESKYILPPLRPNIKIYVFWGVSGGGKSHNADLIAPQASRFPARDTREGWFDGYYRHEVVLFNEFTCKYPYRDLLQLCDKYALRLPIKGGFVPIFATTIIFTSKYDPMKWYGDQNEEWQRRLQEFGKITHFDRPYRSGGSVLPPTSEAQKIL